MPLNHMEGAVRAFIANGTGCTPTRKDGDLTLSSTGVKQRLVFANVGACTGAKSNIGW